MSFAEHNIRDAWTPLSKLILWELTHGRTSRGQPALSYVEVPQSDAGVTDATELTADIKERAQSNKITKCLNQMMMVLIGLRSYNKR